MVSAASRSCSSTPHGLAADAVVIDIEATARRATKHLIAHGHRRIAFVGTDLDETPVNLRLAGYPDTIRWFKVDVVEALSPAVSAVLRDPEFGVPAVRDAEVVAPACATLVAEVVEVVRAVVEDCVAEGVPSTRARRAARAGSSPGACTGRKRWRSTARRARSSWPRRAASGSSSRSGP